LITQMKPMAFSCAMNTSPKAPFPNFYNS
jgi:hypothetical protein